MAKKIKPNKVEEFSRKLLSFNCACLVWNDLRNLADEMFSYKASFQTSVVANIKLD